MRTLILLLFCFGCSHEKGPGNLMGTWEAREGGKVIGRLIFIDHNRVLVSMAGQGQLEGNYHMDYTASPYPLDITVRAPSGFRTLHGTIRFLKKDKLRWDFSLPASSPASFTSQQPETVILLKLQ